MRKIAVLLLFVFIGQAAYAQLITGTQSYTDKKKVRGAIISEGIFWAITDGGIFSFNPTDSSYTSFTKADGLSDASLIALTKDVKKNLWVGTPSGIINVFNPETKQVKKILDIYNTGQTQKQINHLSAKGDTILASTDFGLSLINSEDYSFIDTYFKLGSFPSNSKVYCSFYDNRFYLATEAGIAIQKPGATNLIAPESWDTYTTTSGLPSATVFKIDKYKNTVIASTNRGISKFMNNTWSSFMNVLDNISIKDFVVSGDSLLVLTSYSVVIIRDDQIVKELSGLDQVNKIAGVAGNDVFVSTNKGLCKIASDSEKTYYFPNSPTTNSFLSLASDINGNLWVATGKDLNGVGFYKLSNEMWQNFNAATYPAMLTNDYYKVYASNDEVYFCNWGRGLLKVKENGDFVNYNTTNTPMKGILADPTFLVIAGAVKDSRNNLWILNYDAADRKILAALTPDSTWYIFENPIAPSTGLYAGITSDQYDTKWFYSSDPNKMGLFYYNENKSFANINDDKYGFLSSGNGLNSNSISALLVDKRGDLWIGSNFGVNVITNVGAVLGTGQNPQFKISSLYSLRQQSINTIAVDAVNQKWVGTNQGLFIVTQDGTNLIAAYDSKNSPIPNDQIKSITFDEPRGIAYVGTDGGLTAFYTSAKKPADTFTELEISPSPFIVPGEGQLLKVSGLVKDASIKVLTITGKLIKTITTLGGLEGFWDGKDDDGNYVSSGVYIIVAYNEKGDNLKTGKVAVIRK